MCGGCTNQSMKDTYPTFTTWPYVLVVLLMLCAATRPLHEWSSQLDRIYQRIPRNIVKDWSSISRPLVTTTVHQLATITKVVCAHRSNSHGSRKAVGSVNTLAPVAKPIHDQPLTWSAPPIQLLPADTRPSVTNHDLPRTPNREDPHSIDTPQTAPPAATWSESLGAAEATRNKAHPDQRLPGLESGQSFSATAAGQRDMPRPVSNFRSRGTGRRLVRESSARTLWT